MSDVDEVKSRLNIVDIAGERVTLKKAGRNFKGLCPFHKEKTPSFMVSPERQTFHCFGCGKGGSVIDFVMEYEHIDFLEALEQLAGRAGVTLTKRIGDSPEQKLKEKLYEVNALSGEFYQYMLTSHRLGEKALSYLKNRGISGKSIKTFGLGYSPNSWDALSLFLKKKKFDERILATAGLTVQGNRGFYDRFRGRVMFTLRDHRGNVVGFSGRVLDPTIKEAKYINTSETPVYSKSNVLYGLDVTKSAIAKAGEAIVMEGELDLISSFQEGVSNIVAIKGSALTEGHVRILRRFAKTLVFCLDSDMAGDAASRRGVDIAEREGFEIKAILIPSGKDPDEAVREDPVGFKKAVNSAIPIYDFFLTSIQKRFDLATAFGKKKASEELLPILFRMTNAIVRGHYVKKLAQLIGVSEEYVDEEMRKVKLPLGTEQDTKEKETAEVLTRQEKIELYTLALLLQGKSKELWTDLEQAVPISDFSYPPVKRILQELQTYLAKTRDFSISAFVKTLPSELVSVCDQAYLWDVSDSTDTEAKYQEEWKKTVRELKRAIIRKKIADLNQELHAVDDPTLQERLSELTKELSLVEKSALS
ncbi:TPA: DNA primase [Patescibacteria group bacterium]|nr:DNA primase [Patescibacteria group bacterium]